MRLKSAVPVLLCLLLSSTVALAQSTCPPSGSLSFPVTLSGTQFGGTGSGSAFGTGFVTLNPGNNTATVQLNTMGLGPNVTGAGLFSNGTSFVPFYSSTSTIGNNTTGFTQNGTFTNTVTLTQQQMNAILANPSAYSLGISTGEFPNGALNGTLMNGSSFGGTFSGANVVGSTGATSSGGAFTAMITPNTSGGGSTLNYTFTPTGIGTSFTGLSLNQGGVGANGGQFVNLSNGGTLTNGRFTGSTQLTSAQAQALMANPSNFNIVANTSSFPNGAVRAQFGLAQNEVWLPVVGSTNGMLGNRWTTDVRVYNSSTGAPATVLAELFPQGQTNITSSGAMNASASSTFTINGGNTTAFSNATQSLFPGFSGLAAMRLTSDQPIVAVERIYDANAVNSATNAASAQAIFGLTMCDAVMRGVLPALTGSANASSSLAVHANIGFFNPNATPVTVLVNSANAQGASFGAQQTITLQPNQLVQMPMIGTPGNGLINTGSDVSNGVLTFLASAPIFAYSSVVNNVNADTHVTFAKPDLSSPSVAQSDVAAIVMAANQGEVTEGQLATTKASSSAVAQFAQQMITDHTAALNQAQSMFSSAGITASTNNATAQFLQSQTQQEVNTLNGLSGASFDRTYMQEQVNDHQKLLQMLDTQLIPSASGSPQLLAYLQQMRATVASHLANAQTILAQLP